MWVVYYNLLKLIYYICLLTVFPVALFFYVGSDDSYFNVATKNISLLILILFFVLVILVKIIFPTKLKNKIKEQLILSTKNNYNIVDFFILANFSMGLYFDKNLRLLKIFSPNGIIKVIKFDEIDQYTIENENKFTIMLSNDRRLYQFFFKKEDNDFFERQLQLILKNSI